MSGAFISPNQAFDDQELKRLILKLLNSILDKRPELKATYKSNPEKLDKLIGGIMGVLKNKPGELTRGKVFEPDFIKKLSLCLMVATSTQNNNKFSETLKNIFDGKKIDLKALMKLSPKEFKKLMSEKFSKDELRQLHKELEKCFDDVLKDLQKFGLKPTPEQSKAMVNDAYINLFGLINSAISGGHAVPIPSYVGNGLGFRDWNPYDGSAPIDAINSIKDTQFGDSLGLNASTVANYLSIDDTLVDQLQDVLRKNNLAPGAQQPHLSR